MAETLPAEVHSVSASALYSTSQEDSPPTETQVRSTEVDVTPEAVKVFGEMQLPSSQ